MRLLAITPGDGRPLGPWIEALGAAGLPALLIREPGLPDDALRALVELAMLRVPSVLLHDRHPSARRLVAEEPRLRLHQAAPGPQVRGAGRSCHGAAEVDRALAQGAAYAFLSPVWAPASKPGDRRAPLGLDGFLEIAAGRPVLALGGVSPERYGALMARGAHGAAVLGGLFGAVSAAEAGRAAERYLRASTTS